MRIQLWTCFIICLTWTTVSSRRDRGSSCSDCSRTDWQESLLVCLSVFLWELLNPCNSSSFVSSGDYCLCVCWKNDGLSTFVFLSVREDSWNSIRGGAVGAGCRLLRLIALIICWAARRIYPSFQLFMKTVLSVRVCLGKRLLFYPDDARKSMAVSYRATQRARPRARPRGLCEVILTLRLFYFRNLHLLLLTRVQIQKWSILRTKNQECLRNSNVECLFP